MPTVPTYNGGNVAGNTLTRDRVIQSRASDVAPIEAFGGGQAVAQQAQAVQNLAQIGQNYFAKEKEKADRISVIEADTKAAALVNDYMWNEKDGLYTRKGKNAAGAHEEFLSGFDEQASKIQETLSNDAQKEAFRERVNQRRQGFSEQLEKHVYGEMKKYNQQVIEASLSVAQNEAVSNFTNPEIIAQSIERQKQTLAQFGKDEGMAPEAIGELVAKTTSRTHSLVLTRMLTYGQDIPAKEYYAAVQNEMIDTDKLSADKDLKAGSIRGESQRIADSIFEKSGSLTAAMSEARQITNPDIRDAVEARVKSQFAEKRQAEMYDKETRYDRAQQALEAANGNLDNPAVIANMRGLGSSERQALENRSFSIRSGRKPVHDDALYIDLMTQATTPALREKFLTTHILPYKDKLSPEKFDELTKLQFSLRKGDTVTHEDLMTGFKTKKDLVNDAVKLMDIKPDSDDAIEFNRLVDDEVVKLQRATNKKATPEDIKNITDKLTVKAITEKNTFWFNKTARIYEIPEDQPVLVEFENIPKKDQKVLAEGLRKKGMPATEENISNMYNLWINQNRKKTR